MTREEIEYRAYLFFKEKGLEYVDNIDELIEYCRDFAFQFVSYFEEQIADIKANCDFALEGKDVEIKELKDHLAEEVELHLHAEEYIKSLEQQIEKMKRHCNCKHRDSEGYCEVKRTYLMDLSYDGCDKWESEND